jgi:hypothetical protein
LTHDGGIVRVRRVALRTLAIGAAQTAPTLADALAQRPAIVALLIALG